MPREEIMGEKAVPVPITLCWSEMLFSALAGILFQLFCLSRGTPDSHYGGSKGERPWEAHIEGAAAELVVARYLGTYWNRPHAVGHKKVGDGLGYEVRSTPYHTGHLIVHKPDVEKGHDLPDSPFVLVTGKLPTLTIRGWQWAREMQLDDYWCEEGDKNGAVTEDSFWYPQEGLRDIRTLLASIKGRVIE